MQGVVFLCVQNRARSQMAEGWGRVLLPASVRVWSAGSRPGTEVHPLAIEVMREAGVDISGQRPKPLGEVPLDEVDTVVVLCAEEECPYLPGKLRRLDWKLPDPARAHGTPEEQLAAFRAARDAIRRKVEALARS